MTTSCRASSGEPFRFVNYLHAPGMRPAGQTPSVLLKTCATTVCVILAGFVAVAALGSAMGVTALPKPLANLDERLPSIFEIHMAASGLALMLLPLILLLRHRRLPDRTLGRVVFCAPTGMESCNNRWSIVGKGGSSHVSSSSACSAHLPGPRCCS